MDDVNERGEPITGDTLLVLMNAETAPVSFVIPGADGGCAWDLVVNTAEEGEPKPTPLGPGAGVVVDARALVVLQRERTAPPPA